ncbi:MAG TPA: hypothetical protein VFK38_10570 [Candidatus Limnocylindrales bacterium]|nr:hypothetical protein [Candidatus Limnocylindrales bacterium]
MTATPTDDLPPDAASPLADLPAPVAASPAGQPSADPPADPERRRFFRDFGRQALRSAANVAGTVDAIRRGSAAASGELLGLAVRPAAETATRFQELELRAVMAGVPGEPPSGFRSPYRLAGDVLWLLDQRQLPERVVELECRLGTDVAAAMRAMAVRGGPLLGQVAAYGVALTASSLRSHQPYARNATIRGTAAGLRFARPSSGDVSGAMRRMEARWESVGRFAPGHVLADALRAEADAIAGEALLGHARLSRSGVAELPPTEARLEVLTLGAYGPLGAGMVGTALGVVLAAAADGREVHVWLPETRPLLEGARLAALELARAGVPHTVVPDAGAAFLLAGRRVDVVLLGAERVALDGSVAGVAGGYPLALAAARADVPVLVCMPTSTIDPDVDDAAHLPGEVRPPDELLLVGGVRLAPEGTAALVPLTDVTPPDLITAFVTEEGVVRAPFGEGLARALASAAGRRAPLPEPPADEGRSLAASAPREQP